MSNNFAFIDYDTDFELSKMQGIDQGIIRICANTIVPVKVLCEHAGEVTIENGEVRYVSVKNLKRLLKDIGTLQDSIWGFIVPVPQISGAIWDNKLAKMCKVDEDDTEILNELFDEEIEISSVRSWYYSNLEKYVLRTYMLPLKRFLKSIGKEIIFDLGNVEMQYDLMRNGITPDIFNKAGISLAVHKQEGNIEKELGFCEKDFVILGDVAQKVEKSGEAKVLLIKPTRGMVERFIQGEIKAKPNRLETPSLLSSIEGVYYSDMLSGKGYLFDVADEVHLPKASDLIKYEHILICKSCLFTEKETKRIDRLQKYGVKINDKDLLCDLMQKGED